MPVERSEPNLEMTDDQMTSTNKWMGMAIDLDDSKPVRKAVEYRETEEGPFANGYLYSCCCFIFMLIRTDHKTPNSHL